MNANAYDGEFARPWLGRHRHRAGVSRRGPHELGFAYRRSGLRADEIVARASFALAPVRPEEVSGRLGEMRDRQRRAAQPSGVRTFGSTFKTRPARVRRGAPPAAAEASRRPWSECRRRCFSAKHANFVENTR